MPCFLFIIALRSHLIALELYHLRLSLSTRQRPALRFGAERGTFGAERAFSALCTTKPHYFCVSAPDARAAAALFGAESDFLALCTTKSHFFASLHQMLVAQRRGGSGRDTQKGLPLSLRPGSPFLMLFRDLMSAGYFT